VALALGPYNLLRRTKGDRHHRLVGYAWVVAMYLAVISSFAIRSLRPGHFSWIHGLSAFTFVTLTLGLWGAITHHTGLHRGNMIGSYVGLVGAFIGAVVVPSRQIPQWARHSPVPLALSALLCVALAVLVIVLARRQPRPRISPRPEPTATPSRSSSASR